MDVKISENLFLHVAELNKIKQSLGDNGWKMFAKNIITQFGIVKNEGNNMFLPILNTSISETITIQPGIAFDANVNIIKLDSPIDVSVPASQLTANMKYWVILKYAKNHYESGVVNISTDGALVGVGTDFTSVLRGQPDYPTKVRLESQVNTGDYEVVSVNSSTSAILAGDFIQENNLKYSVVGTFTPGFIPSEDNAQIYEYDSCEIEVRISAEKPAINEGSEFIICAIDYVNAVMQIEDLRVNYLLNNPYVQNINSMKDYAINNILTLCKNTIVSKNEKGIFLEMKLEHGFTVSNFELKILTTGYAIDIISGGCNKINTESQQDLPSFKGWYFLNKTTMAYSVITDSDNKRLFIEELNSESIVDMNVVLIPPFKEIEYMVKLSNNSPSFDVPYFFKFSIENVINKAIIPILYKDNSESYQDSVNVSLKYRMIGDGAEKYPFRDFNMAEYEDYDNYPRVLTNSRFVIPISQIQPEEEKRNYS